MKHACSDLQPSNIHPRTPPSRTHRRRRGDPVALESPLAHARADCAQTGVHLAGRRAEDERDDGVPCDFDVLEGAEDVDFAAGDLAVRMPQN